MFYGILAAIVAAIVGLDQLTKALTVAHLDMFEDMPSVLGIFHITRTENSGAIWGILQGKTWLFVIIMILFLATLAVMIWRKWLTKKFEWICLAFIAGGGIGNMIDRLAYGKVTDMIKFDFVEFPVFNVADCFITVGCFALLIYIIFFDRSKKAKDEDPS